MATVRRLSRYHDALLAAFVSGVTVAEAARQAGTSERTAQRWKARHWNEVQTASRGIVEGLVTRVRNALPGALARLEKVAKESEDDGIAVRAAVALWDIFGRVTDRMQLEERLAALERTTLDGRRAANGTGN
jgi:hypothetical protein